jgi:hypothetical protein
LARVGSATLDALISPARALRVSGDALVFEERERGPDPELRLHFEAVSQFTPAEKAVAQVLEPLIPKHTARARVRYGSRRSPFDASAFR